MSFKKAFETAEHSPFLQHRVGAVVVKKGRVLSTGYNEIRWNQRLRKENIHAEESAIVKLLQARRLSSLHGADIYVSRITPGGRSGIAKPCPTCQNLIKAVGIRRIFYTTDGGATGTMEVT